MFYPYLLYWKLRSLKLVANEKTQGQSHQACWLISTSGNSACSQGNLHDLSSPKTGKMKHMYSSFDLISHEYALSRTSLSSLPGSWKKEPQPCQEWSQGVQDMAAAATYDGLSTHKMGVPMEQVPEKLWEITDYRDHSGIWHSKESIRQFCLII